MKDTKDHHIIQSAGGIVYYLHTDNTPRYLLIKRQALSKKIERVAPKGKLQPGEELCDTALREVYEETGLDISHLHIRQKMGVTSLRGDHRGMMDKDVTYYLMYYTGDPKNVRITAGEGYIGMHKWATIDEVLALLFYANMRELMRSAHHRLSQNGYIPGRL